MDPGAPGVQEATSSLVRSLWGPHAEVSSFSHLAGDASSRLYYRAALHGGAPATVIVMQLMGSSLSISSDELQTLPERPREEPFVNVHKYLSSLAVPIPRLYACDQEAGLILLEDLGDTLLWDKICTVPREDKAALLRKTIDILLTFHIYGTHRPDATCIAFQQRFDRKLFLWEFEHFIEFGLKKRLSPPPSASQCDRFRRHFSDIAEELGRLQPVLTHRDFHSWNLMLRGKEIYVIDFQDCLLAPAQYDLASLLTDRITTDQVDEAMERELIDYYLSERQRREALAGSDFREDEDSFRRNYFLAVLQRALKVIGRFYFLALEKGKKRYLRFVPAEVKQARRALGLAGVDPDLGAAFDQYAWPQESAT